MSVKVTDNTRSVMASIDRQSAILVRMSMDEVIKLSTPKTPKKTGKLRRMVSKRVSGKTGTLTWDARYAKYQERGFTTGPVKKYTTPGTGKYFAANAIKEVTNRLPLLAKKAYKDWN